MTTETILFVVVAIAALVALSSFLLKPPPTRMSTVAIAGFWILFPIVIVATAFSHRPPVAVTAGVTYRPIEEKTDGYVGSQTCQSCHPHNHATWHASYHRTMTQVANEQTVSGDFNDVDLENKGLELRLSRRDSEFWADMIFPPSPDASGMRRRMGRPVVLITGSHHYQTYWYKVGNNTRFLGLLPFVYLIDEQRWIPRDAAFLRPPEKSPVDESGRWNLTCIRCHTTHGRARAMEYDEAGLNFRIDSVDTKVAEFGISCESCHGPGQRHVEANRNPAHRYAQHLGDESDATIVNPAHLSHERSSQVCGQCHGIFEFENSQMWHAWIRDGYRYRPGDDLAATGMRYLVERDLAPRPTTLQERLDKSPGHLDTLFWSDGMVRVSGREYNGLIRTPCFTQGTMSCLTCHSMHQARGDPRPRKEWANDQLRAGMESNHACTQCHDVYREPEAVRRHTHHAPDSTGSLCYNCHMPFTTYGLLKAIRSHEIDSPSVSASQKTSRPNACNQCHLDKSLGWTAGHLTRWYGHDEPELTSDERKTAASLLWMLRGDAGQRALMAWSFGWESARETSGTDWMTPFLVQLFDDSYQAVRLIAGRTFRKQPEAAGLKFDLLGPQQQIAATRQTALERWKKKYRQRGKPAARDVLIDRDGALMMDEMRRLLRERTDPHVNLRE